MQIGQGWCGMANAWWMGMVRHSDLMRARDVCVPPICAYLFTLIRSKGEILFIFIYHPFRGKSVPDVHAVAWIGASTQKCIQIHRVCHTVVIFRHIFFYNVCEHFTRGHTVPRKAEKTDQLAWGTFSMTYSLSLPTSSQWRLQEWISFLFFPFLRSFQIIPHQFGGQIDLYSAAPWYILQFNDVFAVATAATHRMSSDLEVPSRLPCLKCRIPLCDMMNFAFTCRKLWQFLIYLFQLIS